MADGAVGSITPFFTIWTEPRATIRRIVDTDPRRNVIALAAVGSAIGALSGQWAKAMGNTANLSALWPIWVAVVVAIEAAIGVVSLYLGAAVLRWSGGLLGGVASNLEMRAALAWSSVPGITGAIILLIAVLMGVPVPQSAPAALPHIDPSFYKIVTIEGVLGIWGFIVGLKCIGEVHRFSAWRAFAASLIPAVIVVVSIGFIIFAFGLLARHH
jgi:Yip1 domain